LSEGDRSGGAARAGAGRRSPLFRARRIARVLTHTSRPVWTAPAAPAATGALPRSPTPPPAPPRQAPTDIGSSHALEDGPGAQPALAGRRAGPPPPARPPALALSRAQRPAGGPWLRLPTAPAAQSAPNPPPPPAVPHASDWVPVGRRRAGSATRLQHGLGWVGRAQICVWSVPAGACGLPPEAAALFLSLSAASLPFSVVVAPPVEAADGMKRPGVAELGWVGLEGSGRRWLGRKGEREMGEERHRRSRRRRRNDETASRFRRLVGGSGRCKRGSWGAWGCPSGF